MNTNNKKVFSANVIETIRSVDGLSGKMFTDQFEKTGKASLKALKKELAKVPQDFMDQLFGPDLEVKKSADIKPGESLDVKDMVSDKKDKKQLLKKQLAYERRLHQEELIMVQRRTGELRMQLNAVMQEVVSLSLQTSELANETKIASMQSTVEPGVYHIIFFSNLLSTLKSFRKKIENASVWLHAANGRAAKVNWVTNYKKSGAKYLLSGEHYLTRSAG
ncbi:hypothetical protein IPM62_03110 [Candidatus Woesebacteria bacterium]|nr:MAG: hypothetical protein IPM62_03110 [Candidatus Woesebacteria bacterium]